MAVDFSSFVKQALDSPSVQQALQFIQAWNGPLRADETVMDHPGGLFLLQFLRTWESLDPQSLRQHLPAMTELESTFTVFFLRLDGHLVAEEWEQLLSATSPWIRWPAALLAQPPQTEAVFATLLTMLSEFAEDERVMNNEGDWGYFLAWLPRVTLALETFERPGVVIPTAREALARSATYENKGKLKVQSKQQREISCTAIYQAHLLFLLGRSQAWGAFAGFPISSQRGVQWMVQLVLGALYRDYPPKPFVRSWQDFPELQKAVCKCLTHIYGLQQQDIDGVLATELSQYYVESYGCWPA